MRYFISDGVLVGVDSFSKVEDKYPIDIEQYRTLSMAIVCEGKMTLYRCLVFEVNDTNPVGCLVNGTEQYVKEFHRVPFSDSSKTNTHINSIISKYNLQNRVKKLNKV